MRYFAGTTKYIIKNLLFLIIFTVLPAAMLTFLTDVEGNYAAVRGFFTGDIDFTFAELFGGLSLLNFSGVINSVLSVLTVAIVAISISLLQAFMEKHIRYGKRSLLGVFPKLNDTFLPTLFIVFMLAVVYELWAIITSGLILLAVSFLKSAIAVAYVLVVIIFAAMVMLLFIILTQFIIWLPCVNITGFGYLEGLQYANSQIGNKRDSVFRALFVPYVIGLIISTAGSCLLPYAITSLPHLFDTMAVFVIYAIAFMYFSTLMYIVYFQVAGLERADLKKYYNR